MFRPCLAATSLILAAGPTRIALMIPASADSTAPRNELSSQGCTTTVETVGTRLAPAIRRSYFDPCWAPLAPAGMALMVCSERPQRACAGLYSGSKRAICDAFDPVAVFFGGCGAHS